MKKLQYNDVARFTDIKEAKSLPSNILVTNCRNKQAGSAEAVYILKHCPEINAVVTILPEQSPIDAALRQLEVLSLGRKVSKKQYISDDFELSDIGKNFERYVLERQKNLLREQFTDAACMDVQNVVNIWESSLSFADFEGSTALSTTLVYWSSYGSAHDKGTISAHMDAKEQQSDVRIVECVSGSGTVLFADHDFVEDQKSHARIRPVNQNIECWIAPANSAIALRTPSAKNEAMNAKACVHAHGLGIPKEQEQRLTFRHDLVFA